MRTEPIICLFHCKLKDKQTTTHQKTIAKPNCDVHLTDHGLKIAIKSFYYFAKIFDVRSPPSPERTLTSTDILYCREIVTHHHHHPPILLRLPIGEREMELTFIWWQMCCLYAFQPGKFMVTRTWRPAIRYGAAYTRWAHTSRRSCCCC